VTNSEAKADASNLIDEGGYLYGYAGSGGIISMTTSGAECGE
jgi:hypothetical protein